MAIYLAYDGSINGDWVSHYAVRMAARHPERTLHLVHVRDRTPGPAELQGKLGRIAGECEQAAVQCQIALHAVRRTVVETLLAAVPAGGQHLLVCGTRVRAGRRGLLAGTVSEELLRAGHCPTLALRVVQPGLLGLPRDFLIPLAGHPRGLTAALPFLALLAADVSRIHLLRVEEVTASRFRRLPATTVERLSTAGRHYLQDAEGVLAGEAAFAQARLDSLVVVSDDVPKEIVIAANRTKARLILMGASQRNLRERFFYGNPIEQVLRETPCDVAVYRSVS